MFSSTFNWEKSVPAYGYSSADLRQWTETGIDPQLSLAKGTLVRIKHSAFTTPRTTRVESVYINDLGTVIFVMQDGAAFSRNEFEVL